MIQVAEGHRIRILFKAFSTDDSDACLEVTDSNRKLLTSRISSRTIKDIETETETVFLRFNADATGSMWVFLISTASGALVVVVV